jgi:hypothetical protein
VRSTYSGSDLIARGQAVPDAIPSQTANATLACYENDPTERYNLCDDVGETKKFAAASKNRRKAQNLEHKENRS